MEGECGGQLPDEDEPFRRIPDEHFANVTLRSVNAELVPPPVRLRLQNRPFEIDRTDLVRLGPPPPDATGEDVEGSGLRRIDEDGLAHRGGSYLRAHFLSLEARSASSAKAVRAESQNWSSQARIAPSPLGSIR